MDRTTRANILIFLAATSVMVALWQLIAGIQGGGPLRYAFALIAATVAVALFQMSRTTRR